LVYLIMGVLASGKTTIGMKLAERLKCGFFDADDYHSYQNRQKMAAGSPLDDVDRAPWLGAVKAVIDGELSKGADAVMACSALKEKYRQKIIAGRKEIRAVFLKGSKELITERAKLRQGHFVSPAILDSQFSDLEEPEDAIVEDINKTPEEIVEDILRHR
jgi:gluconokinase